MRCQFERLYMIQKRNKKATSLNVFWLPAALMSSIGLISSFVALMPGTMTFDSFAMYGMGITWQFSDWHHPFMAVLMAFSRVIANDTSILLFLQLAALWTGIYLFALSMRLQIGIWALLSILIGFSPMVVSQAGYLHKTPLQTAIFLMVFGVCYYYHTIHKHLPLYTLFFLLLALFLGTTIRVYSYISVIPILIYIAYLQFNGKDFRSTAIRSIIFSLSILTLFGITDKILVYKVLNAKKTLKSQLLFKYDLAGIMAHSGDIYSETLLKAEYSTSEAILELYQKHKGLWRITRIYKDGGVTQTELSYLFDEWLRAIGANPSAYFKHRWNAISRSMGIGHRKMFILRTESAYLVKTNKYDLKKNDNVLWRLLKKYIYAFDQTIFFKPWFWFSLNLIALVISTVFIIHERFSSLIFPHFVLISSGSLFFLPYLFICLDHDLRFVYWGIVATVFALFGIITSMISTLLKQRSGAVKNPSTI